MQIPSLPARREGRTGGEGQVIYNLILHQK